MWWFMNQSRHNWGRISSPTYALNNQVLISMAQLLSFAQIPRNLQQDPPEQTPNKPEYLIALSQLPKRGLPLGFGPYLNFWFPKSKSQMRLPHSGNVTTPQRPLGKATLIATGASVAPSMAAFICIGGPKKDLFLEPTNNLGTTEPDFGSGSIYLYILW